MGIKGEGFTGTVYEPNHVFTIKVSGFCSCWKIFIAARVRIISMEKSF